MTEANVEMKSEALKQWAPRCFLVLQHKDQKTAAPGYGVVCWANAATPPLTGAGVGRGSAEGVLESLSCLSHMTCIKGKEGEFAITIPVSLQEIAA